MRGRGMATGAGLRDIIRVLIPCQNSNLSRNPAMNPDLLALIRRHLEAENAHDLDGTLATLHSECEFKDCAPGQGGSGHEGAAAHYRQGWTPFDVEVRRGEGQRPYTTADDVYIGEATWHGRHIGRFLGIEPTGRTIVQPF